MSRQIKPQRKTSTRIQTPFIGSQTQADAQKSANTKPTPDDLITTVPITDTNAKKPTTLTTDTVSGRTNGTFPGESVK